jgi:hypothetical protein
VNAICEGQSEVMMNWNGRNVEAIPLDEVRDVPSKSLSSDYPELIAAQSMGIYCGST